MFDEYVDTMAYADGTESTDAGKIVMEIDAGRQDKIALFNLEATSVELVIKDSSSVVLETYTHNLATEVGDWEEYFFKDFETSFDLIQDFIALLASTITITIEHSDSGVYPGLGMLLIGADHDVGQEKMDMLAGFQGFKSASDFQLGGQVSPYPNEETVSADVRVPTEDINRIQRVIAGVRDNVTLYETIDNMYEPFVILGVLQEWSLTYKGDRYCEYSIQIEGIK